MATNFILASHQAPCLADCSTSGAGHEWWEAALEYRSHQRHERNVPVQVERPFSLQRQITIGILKNLEWQSMSLAASHLCFYSSPFLLLSPCLSRLHFPCLWALWTSNWFDWCWLTATLSSHLHMGLCFCSIYATGGNLTFEESQRNFLWLLPFHNQNCLVLNKMPVSLTFHLSAFTYVVN